MISIEKIENWKKTLFQGRAGDCKNNDLFNLETFISGLFQFIPNFAISRLRSRSKTADGGGEEEKSSTDNSKNFINV